MEKAGITHAPTIGEMYEGLTSSILNRAIPAGAGLKVVSGFIEGNGQLSGQIDCMLVSGAGSPVPHTKHFKWPVQNVIAVLEVKKRLSLAALADAHDHLRNILDIHGDYCLNTQDRKVKIDIEPAMFAFQQIAGRVAPAHEDIEASLSFDLEMIYRTLIVEQISPIRVILAYGGYKSEHAVREAFAQLLEENLFKEGFGAPSLPHLVIGGKYSLVKTNGFPYSIPMRGNRWLIMCSSSENPLIFLLELIWTRLSYSFSMPDVFLNDLSAERMSPLLSCQAQQQDQQRQGWMYWIEAISKKALEQELPAETWRPFEVSLGQFIVINKLCANESLSLDHPIVAGLVAEDPEGVNRLVTMRLVAVQGNELVLLTRRCLCAILPSGEYVVGDNSSGRMTAWMAREMRKRKPLL
jgi:hypothetical protein